MTPRAATAPSATKEQLGADPGPAAQSVSAPAALTVEEIVDRLIPDDPQLSPDGRTVVFSVAPVGKRGEQKEQGIWISCDGGVARAFSAGTAEDAEPRWAPDGTRIVFRSDRAERGVFKLYLIDVTGGEARALGDLDGELSALRWSPAGRSVALLRKDRETPEEKRRKEEREDGLVVGDDLKRTRLWIVDVETGRARCLTYGSRHVWSYAWAPFGDRIAIVSGDSPELNALFHSAGVAILPGAGGVPRTVATFPMVPGEVVFVETADGPLLVVRANDHRADPSPSAWVVPAGGGQARNVLPVYRGIIEWLGPLPGAADRVAIRMVEGTHGLVYDLDPLTGELSRMTPPALSDRGSVLSPPSFSADGSRFAVVWSDGATPEEVYVGGVKADAASVTEFGEPFRGRLRPVETVRWQSTDGLEIEGLLTLPDGYQQGRPYPLVVEVHGGPAGQWEDRVFLDWHDWAQLLANRGYAVLAPNPRGSTGYGSEFERLLQDDIGGGEAQDLISGARAMVDRGIADPDRLGIAGWSWGGYLTAWTITQTDLFKAAVMGAGVANAVSDHAQGDIPSYNLLLYPGHPYAHPDDYWERSPIRQAARITTPTLILHGDDDARVHPGQGVEFHRALKTLGVPVEFVRYPREGHPILERAHQVDLLNRLVGWFDRWIGA